MTKEEKIKKLIYQIPFLELDVDIDLNKLKSELRIIEKNLEMAIPSPKSSYFRIFSSL